MKIINRRRFIQSSLMMTAVGAFLSSSYAMAAWPELAYKADSVDGVLSKLFGNASVKQSDKITLKMPDIAENGAVVPVHIKTTLPNIESVSLLVKKNPNPLAAKFNMSRTDHGNIGTRIKMGESSDVIAVVQSDGKLYTTTKFVKVTIGGCGG